ncbi:phytanoyl-CoA dioxygenase [Leptospira sp. GIMC2001]|uniref:phytanoyl-CoA dioxygenase n=1 Tax=Leptospira sp. GIMC2001 TaxID=1513297 RepID=UPI00234B1506|nr:phytanoyl-CoA dioxygenase [Leptospira sp. GIMC2001]WCL51240.1 phytanoyl-CoA dioxygenase [Leptospira sp. GIMC2001]
MNLKSSIINRIKYFDRYSSIGEEREESITKNVSSLKKNGFLILDEYISGENLKNLQSIYKNRLEEGLKFETPCLAQSLIDDLEHSELIENYFRYNPNELVKYKITFDHKDFLDYKECLNKYRPSTLKTYLSDIQEFYSYWLDENLLKIIESYMGIRPHMVEAYLRRNFPAKYKVMNHFWHRDSNHPEFLIKAFIFLSDCKLTNGPHEYVSGSIQDRSLDGKAYYTDQDVDSLYPDGSIQRIKSIVKAGTVILEDTRGLHRATIPKEGYRDLGFAVFLPLSKLQKQLKSMFWIDKNTYSSLSSYQKSFIPKQNIR